jgi:hypothetical protein
VFDLVTVIHRLGSYTHELFANSILEWCVYIEGINFLLQPMKSWTTTKRLVGERLQRSLPVRSYGWRQHPKKPLSMA